MPRLENIPLLKKMIELGNTMLLIVLLSAITGLILSFPVMWLWNFVFMNFANLHINVFQAWALNVLVGILFGYKTNAPSKEK